MKHSIKIHHKEVKLKIDNSIQSVPNVSANDGKKRTDASPTVGVGQENASNAVHISSRASNLQSIDGGSVNGSVVDMSRVQEIKQAISDGAFKVNPDVVADRLLETVKELIKSKEGDS
ncbi:MAG TPA: flagellar biosynthesis anti-sigma factor FlgM [Nitrosomonas sp.]|uniref:flagellar biosynthesis anti-sigma factor FlgM n=1 Tax=Nitrosomonas sp. TaxID=42353 RepID=UPI000E93BB77|nr:flagellar biosynthesis anti-sigma factor FlgM [Nitrosomonas sp.]GJL75880.1 MAG: flagellar biosynthesis anti-sigma factor FlgM [Nitrosomonas sp.]HBV20396.1 flagellar biosynthesis anti-sigma factor FlgM [Nitrosomonas sp.]HNP26652.1 flagellar biosynthesis anti-sigma factor FlgM [Nitrosomonas sp.]